MYQKVERLAEKILGLEEVKALDPEGILRGSVRISADSRLYTTPDSGFLRTKLIHRRDITSMEGMDVAEDEEITISNPKVGYTSTEDGQKLPWLVFDSNYQQYTYVAAHSGAGVWSENVEGKLYVPLHKVPLGVTIETEDHQQL